jgi:hypothetical protein
LLELEDTIAVNPDPCGGLGVKQFWQYARGCDRTVDLNANGLCALEELPHLSQKTA